MRRNEEGGGGGIGVEKNFVRYQTLKSHYMDEYTYVSNNLHLRTELARFFSFSRLEQ